MSLNSKIEWTDATWNPVRGCTKISPGCKNCYAAVFAERFRGVPGHPYEQGFDLRLVPEKLAEPFSWARSKMVFVNSMSDLFHKDVPDEFIVSVTKVMVTANWHIFQVLTKRADRLKQLLDGPLSFARKCNNIWWGVSVENIKHGFPRIDLLRQSKVAVKFLSIEPLLEDLAGINLSGISWAIVGGESGPGARPMKAEWVTKIKDACKKKKVPFFFKQWGGVRKSETGRELSGRTYDEMPNIALADVPSSSERTMMANKLVSETPQRKGKRLA